MYEGTSTEQKAKNAKSGLDSMSKPLLQSIRQHNTLLPPFTQRRLNSVCLIYMACFSPLYRQSEPQLNKQAVVFVNSVSVYPTRPPDKVLRIKDMPKNANGKLDRKALQTIYKTL